MKLKFKHNFVAHFKFSKYYCVVMILPQYDIAIMGYRQYKFNQLFPI